MSNASSGAAMSSTAVMACRPVPAAGSRA
jgi:hypothetical protein